MKRLAPFFAFFCSGASSLVFQMIWSRLLHHVFGSSSIAISSVVSVFMAGLGLGAFLFGRYADRIARPLLLYASAELGVGVFALCVPWLVRPEGWLAFVNAALRQHFGGASFGFMLARFLCIVPVLIVPTTLMGSTLPLLSRHFVTRAERAREVGVRVGALYAVNTLGAVAGVFMAGFVSMPRIGVAATNAGAVGLNFALAAGIFALRRQLGETGLAPESAPLELASAPEQAPFPLRVRRAAALAFAASGFCSLLFEVVWSRALVNTIGGSVYAFALILMTFLFGIATGSAFGSAALAGEAMRARSILTAAIGLSLVAPLPLGLRYGALGWFVEAAACALVAGWLAARGRASASWLEPETSDDSPPNERTRVFPLVAPLVCGALNALWFRGRLELIVLAALCAIAILCAALVLLHERLVLLLATAQTLIALSTFTSDLFADQISLTFAGMVAPFYRTLGEHVDRVLAMMFATAALCILPSALGMGAMFPLTMRAFSAGGARVGREVGAVYTGNTVGSIIGAWLPGFLLMPSLGMQATLHIGIAINLWLAALVLWVDTARRKLFAAALAFAALASLGLYFASAAPSVLTWNLSKMTLGVFRISLAKDVLDQETWGEPDLVFYKDGLSTTVSVERWGRHYSLKNNGKVEASNGNDMPTQIMVAALPLLLHPKGAAGLDVAIIGLGSGVTVGAALQFPIRSLQVIELERAVAQASRFFENVNHLRYGSASFPYLRTPRLELINDDGRNYLASTKRQYDLIVGEPSNPWLTGVSDLFTADHVRIAKRRLKANGVYCEWVQLYEMSPENVKIIYRTFAAQFRHVVVFSSEDLSSDTILVGSDSPLPLDVAHLRAGYAAPGVAAELERAYVHSPFDVLARVLLSNRNEVLQYAQIERRATPRGWTELPASTNVSACAAPSCRRDPSPINTDDNALIEFAAPRDLIGFERYKGYLQTIYAESWPFGRLRELVADLDRGKDARENRAELALSLLAHGRKREAASLLEPRSEPATEAERVACAMYDALKPSATEPALPIRPPLPDSSIGAHASQRIVDDYAEVRAKLARGDVAGAKSVIMDLPSSLVRYAGPDLRFLRGYVLYRKGDFDDALGEFESIARSEPRYALEHPELYFFLGRSHDALLHFDKAVRAMRVYVAGAVLGAAGRSDDLPALDPRGVPETDAPGESDKSERYENAG